MHFSCEHHGFREKRPPFHTLARPWGWRFRGCRRTRQHATSEHSHPFHPGRGGEDPALSAWHEDEIQYYKRPSKYGKFLEELVAGKKWVELAGVKFGEEKVEFLLSGTFAIHAMRTEAFGISVTEYLKAGLVTIVPDEGGSREIVANDALTYSTLEEAAAILSRLAADAQLRERMQAQCRMRGKCFSRETYLEGQRKLLAQITAQQL